MSLLQIEANTDGAASGLALATGSEIAAYLRAEADEWDKIAKAFDEPVPTDKAQCMRIVAERMDTLAWLETAAFMAYRDRDPDGGKLYNHFTVVNEDEKPSRRGHVFASLHEAVKSARSASPNVGDEPRAGSATAPKK